MDPSLLPLLAAEEAPGLLAQIQGWVISQPVLITIVKVLAVGNGVPALVSFLVWLERRAAAWIQDRMGPNRVGPFGLFQSVADLVKFIFKEDVLPDHVNKPLFLLAPALAVIPAFVVLSFIPFTEDFFIADVDAGILAAFAFGSIGVYALALGGWASNSKYSLLGGVRASAQMISYELVLGLSALSVFLISGDLRLKGVVYGQADGLWIGGELLGTWSKFFDWNIVKQPIGAMLFLVAGFAEVNRHPFDMPEAESELAAGYHTEYSSMKFALFFLAEYAAMISISGLFTTLYLGGWTLFGVENMFAEQVAEYGAANPELFNWPMLCLQIPLQLTIFGGKTFCLLFLFIWVRWTLPRFRYDQLMRLGWVRMLPMSLLWIALTAIGVAIVRGG